MNDAIGRRFAAAVAAKDADGLAALLHPDVEFRGLTPGRFWEATSARGVVDEVILGVWLDRSDQVDELVDVTVGSVADRDRVGYRLRVTNPTGSYLVEQQAYFDVEGDRITSLRIMCSGFRPVESTQSQPGA